MKRGSAFGWVMFLGCVLLGCKMFKKDEPVPDAAAEPPPAAEAAATEDAETTAVAEAAAEEPTPTTNTPLVKKDGGVKDASTTSDASTAKTDAATPVVDAGPPVVNQCKILCGAGYTACVFQKKGGDTAKCKTDRDACLAKCK